MKQVILNVKESKYDFFMELVKSLGFVKVESVTADQEDEEDSKEQILKNIEQSFKELKLYREGKKEFRDAKELFNEL